jgi:hypothetical protein
LAHGTNTYWLLICLTGGRRTRAEEKQHRNQSVDTMNTIEHYSQERDDYDRLASLYLSRDEYDRLRAEADQYDTNNHTACRVLTDLTLPL